MNQLAENNIHSTSTDALSNVLQIFFKRIKLISVIVGSCAAAGLAIALLMKPVYFASSKIVVEKDATIADVIQAIADDQDPELTLVIPKETVLRESIANFQILKRTMPAATPAMSMGKMGTRAKRKRATEPQRFIQTRERRIILLFRII